MSVCFPGNRTPAAAEVCVTQSGEQPTWFSLVSINATAQTQPWSGLPSTCWWQLTVDLSATSDNTDHNNLLHQLLFTSNSGKELSTLPCVNPNQKAHTYLRGCPGLSIRTNSFHPLPAPSWWCYQFSSFVRAFFSSSTVRTSLLGCDHFTTSLPSSKHSTGFLSY